jgi:beta-glucosidase
MLHFFRSGFSLNVLTLFMIFFGSITCVYSQNYPFEQTSIDDEARLTDLIQRLTLEEKIRCLSTRPSIPRLGVKGTRIVEGLHGLALSGVADWAVKGKGESATTTFPQAYGLAQTWDPEMLQNIASLEADECRYLTQHPKYASAGLIMLAPNADLGRDVRWGRTEECYGEDAFLTATLAVQFVKGLQGNNPKYWKTASMMKHFLANSNENNRYTNSSDFDERLFREYYSYPFYKGITEGGARAYMAAYNKYNGIPCAVHPFIKNITVNQWHNDGIVATDGGAFQKLVNDHKFYPDLPTAAAACIKAGITMFLDDFEPYLKEAVTKNLVTEKEIDVVLRGTLRVLLKLGLLDKSAENPYANIGITDTVDIWTKPETHAFVRKVTAASVVLLKNENNFLPLRGKKIKRIAVLGPSANLVVSDWYSGTPPYSISALQGIKNAVDANTEVVFAASNKADSAVLLAKTADMVIVCVGNHPVSYGLRWGQNQVASDGREEVDRQSLTLEQEDLVKLVYKVNKNVVLAVVSSFPYTLNWSKQHIPAIVHITQSSQELGNGLADVIFGKVNPAARLVQTWPTSIDDLLPILDYDIRHGRTYMYSKQKPLFAFGHGLSYTRFAYSNLNYNKTLSANTEKIDISFTIKNTGAYDGDEVAQLYVNFLGSKVARPTKALKAFKRVFVKKGGQTMVKLTINSADLMYWNTSAQKFVLEPGKIQFFIGSASDKPFLNGMFTIR